MFEPTEKSFAGGVREWSLQDRFPWARRLTDEYDVAKDRTAGHGRGFHPRATPASQQLRNMRIQVDLFAQRRHQRRKIDNSKLSKMLRMMQVTIGK